MLKVFAILACIGVALISHSIGEWLNLSSAVTYALAFIVGGSICSAFWYLDAQIKTTNENAKRLQDCIARDRENLSRAFPAIFKDDA